MIYFSVAGIVHMYDKVAYERKSVGGARKLANGPFPSR